MPGRKEIRGSTLDIGQPGTWLLGRFHQSDLNADVASRAGGNIEAGTWLFRRISGVLSRGRGGYPAANGPIVPLDDIRAKIKSYGRNPCSVTV